jgi:DNA repair protein RecO (recombination protein O)
VPRATGQRTYRTEGIVLRGHDLGEADRILTILTRDRGKIRAVAKGVRKMTSKKAGHLEPFCRTSLLLAQGRDLDVVSQAEMIDGFAHLRSTLDLLGPAFYLAELVDAFTEDGAEHRALYEAFTSALVALEHGADTAAVTRWFELFVLTANGLAPSWTVCAGCGAPIEPETEYVFSLERGGLLCPNCRSRDPLALPVMPGTVKVLRLLAREPLARIVRLRMPYDALSEAEEIMARAIRVAAERELRSPLVLQRLQTGMGGRDAGDGVR